jgi:hypothetical protein
MKALIKNVLAIGSVMLISVAAHAQSNNVNGNVVTASGATTNVQSVYVTQPQVHEKTRAEVYQELVQAEKDGSLKKLDETIYKGN